MVRCLRPVFGGLGTLPAYEAGYIVETKLGALALDPVFVGAGASIHGPYH